ncbi:MAG: DUF167 domain-containing protein [Alphaproteobacteria bacterium]|nr:DUF167 domain-containing protein [Alphaproteobacteria bacterium]
MAIAPALPFRARPGGLELRLRVTPKAAREDIAGLKAEADGGTRLSVKVRAAPERGRANAAVIALLARRLDLPKSAFRLLAGESDRDKTLLVSGEPEELGARAARLIGAAQ